MSSRLNKYAVLFLGATLSACGGGGGGSSSATTGGPGGGNPGGGSNGSTLSETVTVSASLGRITNATVKIYGANYSEVIGEGVLDEAGKAAIEVTYSSLEPAIVAVSYTHLTLPTICSV